MNPRLRRTRGNGRSARRPVAVALIVALLALPARAFAWSWPVDGPVLSTFSFDPGHPYAAGQRRGIEIGGEAGAPVLAPAGGVVAYAGTTPGNGLTLSLRTPDGYAVSLTHLGALSVRSAATVSERDVVGTLGADGSVHLGVRRADDDNGYVDPLGLLPVREPVPVAGNAPRDEDPVPVPAAPP